MDCPDLDFFQDKKPGTAKLKKGEVILTCPYEVAHKSSDTRFHAHLEKCRRNYLMKKEKNAEEITTLSCKYSFAHQVIAPELKCHEDTCPDSQNGPLEYLLRDSETIEEILRETREDSPLFRASVPIPNDGSFFHSVSDVEEGMDGQLEDKEKEIWQQNVDFVMGVTGIDIDALAWDIVNNAEVPLPPDTATVEEGKVYWADPQDLESGISPFPKVIDRDVDGIRRRRRIIKKKSEPSKNLYSVKEETETGSECWGNKPASSSFNWLTTQFQNNSSVGVPLRYPPGLNKSARKNYATSNSEKLKTEFGIFSELSINEEEENWDLD